MKHLRKFNENTDEVLDIEYIKHCFVEIFDIDDADAEIDTTDYDPTTNQNVEGDGKSLSLHYSEPSIKKYDDDLDEYINFAQKLNKLNSDLKRGLDRLKGEYPNYKIDFHHEIDTNPDDDFIQRIVVLDISL
jgi:hypothetical protein